MMARIFLLLLLTGLSQGFQLCPQDTQDSGATVQTLVGDRPEYVGCFSSSYVSDHLDYYKARNSMVWQEAVTYCRYKLSRYAGLCVDPSNITQNLIYCGNDIMESSPRVSDDDCGESDGRRLGGDDTMAVYMVRDSIPLAVLYGHGNLVKLWVEGTTMTVSVDDDEELVWKDLDYDYGSDELYYTKVSTVWRNQFNHLYFSGAWRDTLTTVLGPSDVSIYESVSWDWRAQRMFYSQLGELRTADWQGDEIETVLTWNKNIEDIENDPYEEVLFFVDSDGQLFTHPTESGGEVRSLSDHVTQRAYRVHGVALDTRHQLLYRTESWQTEDNETVTRIVSSDYQGGHVTQVYAGPELNNAGDLDAVDDEVVWVAATAGWEVTNIYSCKMTPTCRPRDVRKIVGAPAPYGIMGGLKIYHPERQLASTAHLCRLCHEPQCCVRHSLQTVDCVDDPTTATSLENTSDNS